MGLRGFGPLTSPLSGVRSNQLSYRPVSRPLPLQEAATRSRPDMCSFKAGQAGKTGLVLSGVGSVIDLR